MPRHPGPELTVSQLRAKIVSVLGQTKSKKMAPDGIKKKIREQEGGAVITSKAWREAVDSDDRLSEANGRITLIY